MSMKGGAWWCLVAGLLLASPAAGQTCLGRLSFSESVQMQFAGAFDDGEREFSVGVAGGGQSGFGGANLVFRDVNAPAFSTGIGVGGFGGGEIQAGRAVVCPVGGADYFFGPDFSGLETRTLMGRTGVHVGVPVVNTAAVQVIPTAGLDFVFPSRFIRLMRSALMPFCSAPSASCCSARPSSVGFPRSALRGSLRRAPAGTSGSGLRS